MKGLPVVLITRTVSGRDSFGNDTYTDGLQLVRGVFAPGGSSEQVGNAETVVTQPTLYLSPDFRGDFTAVDAVVVNPQLDLLGRPRLDGQGRVIGDRYNVDGQPTTWTSPFTGRVVGTEVKLIRATG